MCPRAQFLFHTVPFLEGSTHREHHRHERSLFTLYTNIYQSGSVYATQYDLRNVSDAAGLTFLDADFSYAGKSSMNVFFGDAPNASGIIYHDGAVGSSVTNNGSIDYNTQEATMSASIQNGQGVQQTTGAALAKGQDTLSQLGFNGHDQYGSCGYLYVQTTAKPVQNTIWVANTNGAYGTVSDCAGAPCGTPTPRWAWAASA